MTRLAFIIGTRPQYIKVAPLLREMADHDIVLIDTGQHYNWPMSGAFYKELGIREPDHKFRAGARVTDVVQCLINSGAGAVVVFGDTDSAILGAKAAKIAGLKLVHVEAGVRSGNLTQAEEGNRIIIDLLADIHLCPNDAAAERVGGLNTGDIMRDALAQNDRGGYALATIHRQENVDNPLQLANILACLEVIPAPVIIPAHHRLAGAMRANEYHWPDNVLALSAIGYQHSIALQRGAAAVITDSGGIQREAAWLGVPCIVLRTETEWPELVEPGFLTGPDSGRVLAAWERAVSGRKVLRETGATRHIAGVLKRL